jgi:hypothetical protein
VRRSNSSHLAALVLTLGLGGCSHSTDESSYGLAPSTAATTGQEGDAGAIAVFATDTEALAIDLVGGGPAPPMQPGDECQIADDHYTLDFGTRGFTSSRCVGYTASKVVRTSRVVTEAEARSVKDAMKAVVLVHASPQTVCAADMPMTTVTTRTPRGNDSFNVCGAVQLANGARGWLDDVDGVVTALRDLDPNP